MLLKIIIADYAFHTVSYSFQIYISVYNQKQILVPVTAPGHVKVLRVTERSKYVTKRIHEGFICTGLTLFGILCRVKALNALICKVTINLIYTDKLIIAYVYCFFKINIKFTIFLIENTILT